MALAALLKMDDPDGPRVIEAWRKACDLGVGDGCFALARHLEGDDEAAEMPEQVLDLYEKACAAGHAEACWRAGVHRYREGDHGGVGLIKKACDLKHAHACTELGQLLIAAIHVPQDLPGAVAAFRAGCDLGEALSCVSVGYLYQRGQGTAVDRPAAARAFDKACQAGDGGGCNQLGFMRLRGEVPRDDAKSVEEFRKSCAAGEQAGCDSLGFMLQNGKGGNETEAAKVFSAACASDNAYACLNQGLMEWFGRGGLKDKKGGADRIQEACYQRPAAFLQSECSTGDPESCGAGALLFATGQCCTKDVAEAKRMGKLACKAGYPWTCARLKEVGIIP